MEDSSVFKQFVQSLEKDYEGFDDRATLLKNLTERFQADFEEPPIAELSRILRFHVTPDAARRMFFAPQYDDARHYPTLLAKGDTRLKSSILSLLFLKHRKQWDFLRVFIIAGGVLQLCALLLDSNLYSRGQAVETFLSVTDCDTYDWFNTGEDVVSHCLNFQLFSLGDSDSMFLPALFGNRPQSYPGGSYHALQILAFWLSWMRARFTPDQRLRLHPYMFRELEAWATTESVGSDANDASGQLEENERNLARTLMDDFKREPPLDVANPSEMGFDIGGIVRPSGFADSTLLVDTALVSIFPDLNAKQSEILNPVELKDAGNKYYKDNNFVKAFELYSAAKDALSDESGNDLRASILFNLASVHWKFYKSCDDFVLNLDAIKGNASGVEATPCSCGDPSAHNTATSDETKSSLFEIWGARRKHHLGYAESLSQQVVDLTGGSHSKAFYRLASCLLARSRAKEAYELLDQAVSSTKLSNSSEIDMLRGLMRQCIASILAKNDDISTGNFKKPERITADSGESPSTEEAEDLIVNELSCLRTSTGQPVLNKATTDILRRLRMRDQFEKHVLGKEVFETDAEDMKQSRYKAAEPHSDDQSQQLEKMTLPTPPKVTKAGSKSRAKVPSAADSAKAARKKLLQKFHKSLRSSLLKNDSSALRKIVHELWANQFSIAEVMMESLDEESILKMIELALASTGSESEFGFKVLRQLQACSRFESQFRFAVHGDAAMTNRVKEYLSVLQTSFADDLSGLDELKVYNSML